MENSEYIKKYAKEAKNSEKTCFRCYFYLKSLRTDRETNDTVLSVCLNPEYKWFGDEDLLFSNWFDTKERTMQGTLIEKSKQNPVGCITPQWCKTGRILKDIRSGLSTEEINYILSFMEKSTDYCASDDDYKFDEELKKKLVGMIK